MLQLDTHEIAWAAGLFDGEGNINFHEHLEKRTNKRAMILSCSISQSGYETPEVLKRFRNAVDVGVIRGPRITENRQPIWKWQVSSFQDIQFIIALLWKYLSTIKRQQARCVLLRAKDFYDELETRKAICRRGLHNEWEIIDVNKRRCKPCYVENRRRNNLRRKQRRKEQ